MSDRPSGQPSSRLVAVLGPTNTGKTHLAVERMLGHASGMIGLPLRLLAREVYDRVVKTRGARAVALITGEEKIVPPRPHYFICTVEAMPLNREVEFLAVDEIQLCSDAARGHVFTQRLLHARGKYETMFLGAGTAAGLIKRLLPDVEIQTRERFSTLSYDGSRKLTRLPRRSAIVAFSSENVYAIAELIRRQRGGAAVVMGSLSPRTRNAQVALYQSGEVDFLVATDAIGMGLNMEVDHVAFAGLRKFDGKRTRWLRPQEVGQIAGRAGRFRKDGTFGITSDCPEMDDDLVAAVENHRFQPLVDAEWRNARLEFDDLPGLMRSLSKPPAWDGLKLAEESLDEKVLRIMAADSAIATASRRPGSLKRLWEVCQMPDFRKTTMEDHIRLVSDLYAALISPQGRIQDDWFATQFAAVDRLDGEIDALSGRLSGIRTLAYIANRPDWMRNAQVWRDRTRDLEDRISDTLHQRLMARFVDRRTSLLLRQLGEREALLSGIDDTGVVTVQGHVLGRLRGVAFDSERSANRLEEKALRGAAQKAVVPEINRRLGHLASSPPEALKLLPDGTVTWNGDGVATIHGINLSAPQVHLYGSIGDGLARQRATRRIEAWLADEAKSLLPSLDAIEGAIQRNELKGLPRGICHRLIESGGIVDRQTIQAEVHGLSKIERRSLRSLGIKIGAHSLFIPSHLTEPAITFATAVSGGPDPRLQAGQVQAVPPYPVQDRQLAARGLLRLGELLVPAQSLENLDDHLRESHQKNGIVSLSETARDALGWSAEVVVRVLKSLGYSRSRKPQPGQADLWRRRASRIERPAPVVVPDNPFATLAKLRPVQPATDTVKRKRRRAGSARRPPA
jgi:ATP-dependent RNA helicase SUPV3L1/SUV3